MECLEIEGCDMFRVDKGTVSLLSLKSFWSQALPVPSYPVGISSGGSVGVLDACRYWITIDYFTAR